MGRATAAMLLGLALIAGPAAAQAPAHPDLTLTGEITGRDHQTYREVPFDVPPGVRRVTVTLAYDRANRTVIDLGVWDPERFRGWSGGTRDRFTLSASDASPGYLAGTIPAGRWRAMLGVPNVRSNSRSRYTVTVSFDRAGRTGATDAISDPPLRSGPGWYRGDFHMHDAHSDGSCASQSGRRVPCPLFRTVDAAARAGLDFVAVTDHNTTAHFGELRELQPWFDHMLLIPGVEVTTFRGHANIFNPSGFVDFRVGAPGVPDVVALQRSVAASGAILSINHPAAPSGEDCMGCGWAQPGTNYAMVSAVEVVNGPLAEGPYSGLAFWYARLNEGYRITGIAGSDNHDPDAPGNKPPIGRPATVVHAASLSRMDVLAGLRAGNVFIDVDGTRDRMLEVEASSGGRRAVMGGFLDPTGGISVKIRAKTGTVATASLIGDGMEIGRKPISGTGEHDLRFTIDARRAAKWISVNLRDDAGHLLAIGNPIYLAPARTR